MRRLLGGLVVGAALALAAACGSSTPTSPTGTTTTDTFTGTVNQNGAITNTFTTVGSGTVTATLTTVAPDATKTIGFAMGAWVTTALGTQACQIVQANDLALQGAILQATASSAGTYCFRVYDTGAVTADTPLNFTVTIQHP
ncbi:MAG TPA: hypothetical protein VG871_02990 [Vicinamibacterales bacterium]|nr:hypothetical protein [Vicinamibacterales bacterium]